MKRFTKVVFAVALVLVFGTVALAAPKVGIMTGTVSQNEEEYRAAEEMIATYGADRIIHVTYPDRFMDEQETTISQVMAMASDPDVKAIVICQGVPGTVAAINKVKEVRDDIVFIIGTAHDEPFLAAATADIIYEIDQPMRGRTIVEKAKEMGAKTFVHYSFPRHMSYPLLANRRDLMEATANELGMDFVFVNAPDPTGEGGVPASQQFILEDAPRQIAQYGPDTALFSTNCSMQEPLIRAVIDGKALYPEQCCPSPFHALPNALGLRITSKGDVPYILNAIEEKVKELEVEGRIATWTAPIVMHFLRAGTAYGMAYANGEFEDRQDIERAKAILQEVAGNVQIRSMDEKAPNFLMVIGESIIFGKK